MSTLTMIIIIVVLVVVSPFLVYVWTDVHTQARLNAVKRFRKDENEKEIK